MTLLSCKRSWSLKMGTPTTCNLFIKKKKKDDRETSSKRKERSSVRGKQNKDIFSLVCVGFSMWSQGVLWQSHSAIDAVTDVRADVCLLCFICTPNQIPAPTLTHTHTHTHICTHKGERRNNACVHYEIAQLRWSDCNYVRPYASQKVDYTHLSGLA